MNNVILGAVIILIPNYFQCVYSISNLTCVEEICIPADYNGMTRPLLNTTNDILVDISKLQILRVDDYDCTITLWLWFYLTWAEPRLIIPPKVPPYVSLDKSFFDELWKPDVYFFNMKETTMKHAFFYESDSFYLINENDVTRKIRYSGEIEITLYCKMKFETYPLDSHVCDFKFGSSKFDSSKLNFTLQQLIFESSEQVGLLDYIPQVTRLPDNKKLWIEVGPLTWYSTGCEIRLDRNVKKYLINYYIPSGLLVIASWVGTYYKMQVKELCISQYPIYLLNMLNININKKLSSQSSNNL